MISSGCRAIAKKYWLRAYSIKVMGWSNSGMLPSITTTGHHGHKPGRLVTEPPSSLPSIPDVR